ncbi:MAG: NUDIX domain-containing protein [Actinomycetota bacterium]
MATTRPSPASRTHESSPPSGYDPSTFPNFAVTVDIVILTIANDELSVLLIQRADAPFAKYWGLPGGFKRPNETLDQAAARELTEETGVTAPRHLAQLHAYGDPERDKRTNVVTIAYLAVVPELGEVVAGGDAINARIWPVAQALHDKTRLAFDHRRILTDAVERARAELEHSSLATAFVAPTFTLSQLRSVYEVVWDTELDPANFRRSLMMGEAPYVEPTGALAAPGPEGGRPPELYRSASTWNSGAPVKRSRRRPDSRS